MAYTVECVHCGAKATRIDCDFCHEKALRPEQIKAARTKAKEGIRKMTANPGSCQIYEQIVSDDPTLFAIGWSDVRDLILTLNDIHTHHDVLRLHGSRLYRQ